MDSTAYLCHRGNPELIKIVLNHEPGLSKQVDPIPTSNRVWTVLHEAALRNHKVVVEILCENGFDLREGPVEHYPNWDVSIGKTPSDIQVILREFLSPTYENPFGSVEASAQARLKQLSRYEAILDVETDEQFLEMDDEDEPNFVSGLVYQGPYDISKQLLSLRGSDKQLLFTMLKNIILTALLRLIRNYDSRRDLGDFV